MTDFPSSVTAKPTNIADGLTILASHVGSLWDEVAQMQDELLGGGTGLMVVDVRPTSSGNTILQARQKTVDTQNRFSLTGSGKLSWGSGTAAVDLSLERTSARMGLITGGLQVLGQAAGDIPLYARGFTAQSADLFKVDNVSSVAVLQLTAAGQLRVPTTGSSGGLLLGGDAQLYRGSANGLVTSGTLDVTGNINLADAAATYVARSSSTTSIVTFATRAAADTQDRLRITAGGAVQFGSGGAAVDSAITRTGVNELTFSGTLVVGALQSGGQSLGGDLNLGAANALLGLSSTAVSTLKLRTQVTGDTNNRIELRADGQLNWGSGSLAVDTSLKRSAVGVLETANLNMTNIFTIGTDVNLYRSGANVLATDDTLNVAANGVILTGSAGAFIQRSAASAAQQVMALKVSGDANDRFLAKADGQLQWGSGSASPDVVLERTAANVLRLNDGFEINGAHQIKIDAGSASIPGLSFITSTGTGPFLSTSPITRMGFSVAGSAQFYVSGNGGIGANLLQPASVSATTIGISGGLSSGASPTGGRVELWSNISVSGNHSFGSFPSPGTGGLYVDQNFYLGAGLDTFLQRTAAGDIRINRSGAATRLVLNRTDGTAVYIGFDNSNQLIIASS